jgi:hypothetical protein
MQRGQGTWQVTFARLGLRTAPGGVRTAPGDEGFPQGNRIWSAEVLAR